MEEAQRQYLDKGITITYEYMAPVAASAKDQTKRLLAAKEGSVSVLGPVDELVGKIADQYRKVIYLKGADRTVLWQIRARMEEYISINEGFDPVTITYENL